MIFANKRVKAHSIRHPFGSNDAIPQKIEESRLLELVTKLRSGDQSVEQEIALGHIRLATQVAARYAGFMPNDSHELVSQAMLGICYALRKAPERLKDDNITGWIVSCVHSFVYRYIVKERRRKLPSPTVVYRHREKVISVSHPFQKGHTFDDSTVDFDDMLEKTVKTEQERAIIELRRLGNNDREISELLKLSIPYIARLRARVYDRYEEMERGLENDPNRRSPSS